MAGLPPSLLSEVQWSDRGPLYTGGAPLRGNAFLPMDDDIFAGVDVDTRSISVPFTSPQGVIRSLRMPDNGEHLVHDVRTPFTAQRVAFASAAGPPGSGLQDGLAAQASPCVVAAPSMLPTAPGPRVKTTRLDRRALAAHLRAGQRRSLHGPSPVSRDLRHLTPRRDTVVRQAVARKPRIKSLWLFDGSPFPPAPPGRGPWSLRGTAQRRTRPGAPTGRFPLDPRLDRWAVAERQVRQGTRAIRRFGPSAPALSRCITSLRTVPGIGWIVARHRLARLGEWRALHNIRPRGGFWGVVPTAHAPGERPDRGAIPPAGDARLRAKRIPAAWSAIRTDPELRQGFRAVSRRHPPARAPRVAIVAVARQLSVRIGVVRRHQRPFVRRAQAPSAPAAQAATVPQGPTRRQAAPGATTS